MSSPQWEPSINDADMKHGPVSKLEKRNKIMSKETGDDIMSRNYDVIVIFPIYDLLEYSGSENPDVWSVKLTFSLIVSFYLTKAENRTIKSLTQL